VTSRGSVVAGLGRNGVGKTTLIRSIIGFTPPRRGQVWFKGVDITGMPSYEISRMGMAIVPQGRRIFSSLNVRVTVLELGKERPQYADHDWLIVDDEDSLHHGRFTLMRSCAPQVRSAVTSG